MGKDLHYTILPFLEKALKNHKAVKKFEKIETDEYIFYKIERVEKPDLKIWASDAYRFNIHDYNNRPQGIDFIYLAKPESDYNRDEVVEMAYNDGINIGKFGALMGVLHQDDIKNYIPKERQEDK
jgi:hypothetical protein